MSATVALCMIVRDEEQHLAACLSSVSGLCAEMIVVDTGSKDGTVAIAAGAGAKVIDFAWCDDFAAARNAGIREANSDWVLILDADERLAPGGVEVVRRVLPSASDFDCGMIKLHDAAYLQASAEEVLSGKQRIGDPMYVPRLLRRTADLAFYGIVHESVRPWLLRNGNRVWDVGTDILHYGACPTERSAKDKGARNTELLEKRLAAEPDDFTIHGYLAHEYLGRSDSERAWAIIEQGWRLMKQSSQATLRSVLRLFAARCLVQFQKGDADGVLESVRDTVAYEGEGPDVHFFRGRAHEMRAQQAADGPACEREAELHAAEHAYRQCLGWAGKIFAQRFVRGGSGYGGTTRLATVLLLLGRAGEALEHFELSLREKPDQVEAQLGAGEALIELGRPSEALLRIEPLLATLAEADAALVCAQAADELGRIDDMKRYLADARERSASGYLATHRNRTHGILHCQLLAYLGHPQPGHGAIGAAAAIIAGSEPRGTSLPVRAPRIGTIIPGERRGLATFVRNLIAAGKAAWVERLLEPQAEQSMPGIGELCKSVVASLAMSVQARG